MFTNDFYLPSSPAWNQWRIDINNQFVCELNTQRHYGPVLHIGVIELNKEGIDEHPGRPEVIGPMLPVNPVGQQSQNKWRTWTGWMLPGDEDISSTSSDNLFSDEDSI